MTEQQIHAKASKAAEMVDICKEIHHTLTPINVELSQALIAASELLKQKDAEIEERDRRAANAKAAVIEAAKGNGHTSTYWWRGYLCAVSDLTDGHSDVELNDALNKLLELEKTNDNA